MRLRWIILVGCVLAAACARAAEPALRPAELQARTDAAVEAAAARLWQSHRGDHWDEDVLGAVPRDRGGRTAVCLYALLACGQSPDDPRVQRTLAWLEAIEPEGVYARAFRACALSLLPPRYGRQTLQADLRWLLEAQRADGAYGYVSGDAAPDAWDNSNTQIAMLGVIHAAEAGLEVPEQYWRRAEQHWLRQQTVDGGWSYTHARARAYGSMTAGGAACLLACFDAVRARDDARCQTSEQPDAPIARALAWLGDRYSPWENPGRGPQYYHYYLYAVARAAVASGYKNLGGHDWYAEGAAELLRTQAPDGGWGDDTDTAFALLFLARGRNPVLFNKLRYDGAWNARPRDLANLARWFQVTMERPVNWQVLDVDAPAEQWYEAPVLYISGAAAPTFTDEQLAKIRAFVDRGGLIVSEAACSGPPFTIEMRRVYARLFPGRTLERLPDDHPAHRQPFPVERPAPLDGISNGVRLLAVHSPTDLSKAWQLNDLALQRGRFQQAANLYLYGSGGQIPRRRLAIDWPVRQGEAGQTLRLAVLSHGGNADPEPLALERFAILLHNRCGVDLRIGEPLDPAALTREDYAVAVISGTGDFTLSDAQRRALRGFLLRDGLLIAHAAGGSAAFDAAVRREIFEGALPEAYVGRLAQGSEVYRLADWPLERVTFNRAARGYDPQRAPQLEVAALDRRPAVLYSELDLTGGLLGLDVAGVPGYAPDSAFEVLRNCVLYGKARADAGPPQPRIDVQWSPAPVRP